MKKVKLTADAKIALKKKLEGLLYRKESIEHNLKRFERAGLVYTNYVEKLKAIKSSDPIERDIILIKIEKYGWEAKEAITTFKKLKREYVYTILPSVEDVTTKLGTDKKSIQFKDIEKEAKELLSKELYLETEKMPANIEHATILSYYKDHIEILDRLIDSTDKALGKESNSLAIAKMEKDIFEYVLQKENLELRLNKRTTYYETIFLPMYNKDMEECEKYFDKYMDRAKEIIKLGVDPKLQFMLSEYEKHKDDKEKLWLFYTSLRTRIDDIIVELMKGSRQDRKQYNHLITPIRAEN